MRAPAIRPFTLPALLAGAGLLLFSPNAHAQSLIVQRGDTLYAADPSGSSATRKLFGLGAPADAFWAIGPDGRRVATLTRSGDVAGGFNLAARPATVYVSELGGRHRKRLFSTDTLHDRLGRSVTALGLGDDEGRFVDWDIAGLAWSSDSRTLYVSCFNSATGAKATFTADGASGAVLVDAQGRWKSIAPLTAIDARASRLVGTAATASTPPASVSRAIQRSGPLVTIDLSTGAHTPLAPTVGVTYAPETVVADPALSPNEQRVAISAPANGLVLLTRRSGLGQQAVAGVTLRPRWSPDGKSVYFLLQRPGSDAAPVFDLYAVDVPSADSIAAAPTPFRLVLQGVDWFDVVPE